MGFESFAAEIKQVHESKKVREEVAADMHSRAVELAGEIMAVLPGSKRDDGRSRRFTTDPVVSPCGNLVELNQVMHPMSRGRVLAYNISARVDGALHHYAQFRPHSRFITYQPVDQLEGFRYGTPGEDQELIQLLSHMKEELDPSN